jgi:hypothetical protein
MTLLNCVAADFSGSSSGSCFRCIRADVVDFNRLFFLAYFRMT